MITRQFVRQQELKYRSFSECPLGLFLYNEKLYVKTGHNSAFDFDGKMLIDVASHFDIHVQPCSILEPFEPVAAVNKKENERKSDSICETLDNRTYAETLCEKTTRAIVGAFKKGLSEYLGEYDEKTVINYLAMENWSFMSNLVATLCWLVDTKGSFTSELEGKLKVFGKELREAYLRVMRQFTC